jgi:tRNA (cmo5U34)-methyltransferase
MTEFNKTNWANAEFARQYRDNADIYIVERRRMFDIMTSFYHHFIAGDKHTQILDLGCGDGIVAEQLFSVDAGTTATLIDGADEMLERARERLHGHDSVRYITASFQEMLENTVLDGEYDFVVSSMAIHHLTMEEKTRLYSLVHEHLRTDGYFMNIDTVLPPSNSIEGWYLRIWQEWMDAEQERLGISGDQFDTVIQRYKDNNDNKPDTLDDQLNALIDIGYKDVDCYYKYGIFAMYGGRR